MLHDVSLWLNKSVSLFSLLIFVASSSSFALLSYPAKGLYLLLQLCLQGHTLLSLLMHSSGWFLIKQTAWCCMQQGWMCFQTQVMHPESGHCAVPPTLTPEEEQFLHVSSGIISCVPSNKDLP